MSFQNARVVCVSANPQDYHNQEVERGNPQFVVSSSTLRNFAFCPSRWRHGYNPPESKAKFWGSLYDARLLTPEQFERRYAIIPEHYQKRVMECPSCGSQTESQRCAKCKCERVEKFIERPWTNQATECAEWNADQEKKHLIPVSKAMVEQCDAAIKRLLADDVIAQWHADSDKQVWIAAEWKDETTGLVIPCRALIDYVPREDSEFSSCAGDLKSSRCAEPFAFKRDAFKHGYHVQGAFDIDMLTAAIGGDRNTWCFILQENYDPWEPNRCMYGQEGDLGQPGFIELGRLEQFGGYQCLLAYYARCLKANKWPGYNDREDSAQGWCVLRPSQFEADRLFVPGVINESEPEEESDPWDELSAPN